MGRQLVAPETQPKPSGERCDVRSLRAQVVSATNVVRRISCRT